MPVLPRYGEASLPDLMPSLLAALDVPGFPNPLGIEPLRRVCLLLVDGLGWEALLANAASAPLLAEAAARSQPLTTGFPATTSASIASIGTGLPPAEHGMVGYTVALPGMDRAFNCLRWSPYGMGGSKDMRDEVVPEQFQPNATAFERAAADGVSVTLVGKREFARSGFTRAALRGGSYLASESLGDEVMAVLRGLGAGRRSLVYAYHPDLDRTGHVRGVGSESWRLHWPTSTCWSATSPSDCRAAPRWWRPATTAWWTCGQSSASTCPTTRSLPPGCACSPARRAPVTSTRSRARPTTC